MAKIVPEIILFDIRSMDEERIQEFFSFFYRNNLMKIFVNEHEVTQIVTGDNDLRAVTNVEGAYRKDLETLSKHLQMASGNLRYEEALTSIIEKPRTFLQLMQNIRKLNRYIQQDINAIHGFNTWNIVYYDTELEL